MSITFIIPTIGRQSLQNSINSLLKQTIKDWHAIIIFDGIKCNLNNNDERIQIIEIEKTGININSAGNVRNYGMSLATTEWIAFLDDDDTIAIDYIETFNYELIKYDDIDVLIFRMIDNEGRIIPKIDADNFYLCDVGISFIIRKEIFDNGLKFIADGAEDFLYLDAIRREEYKMMIAPHVKYFVRCDEKIINNVTCRRSFINMDLSNNFITLCGYMLLNK